MKNKEKEHNHKKKYGQNFLSDSLLLNKIEEVTNITKDDNVIEIGVGLGYLTELIVNKANKVVAFEIDDDLIPKIQKKFKNYDNFELYHQDFLKFDLEKLKGKYKVIANIPYYITSDIIEKLIAVDNIKEIYIMVQKEVGLRITSNKGKDVGLLTHNINFRADSEYLFTIDKKYFDPIPKVDSAFIKIEKKNKEYKNMIEEQKYFDFLKIIFSNKRKTLINNLKNYDKEKIIKILNDMNKSTNIRAEELSILEIIEIIKKIEEI